jgi:hypothetical protein
MIFHFTPCRRHDAIDAIDADDILLTLFLDAIDYYFSFFRHYFAIFFHYFRHFHFFDY